MLACYANAGSANAKLVSESGRIRTKIIMREQEGWIKLPNWIHAQLRVTLGVSGARAARPQMCSIYLGVTMLIIVAC